MYIFYIRNVYNIEAKDRRRKKKWKENGRDGRLPLVLIASVYLEASQS